MQMALTKVDDIIVRNRYRRDFGDMDSLCESIEENGLINPITITDGNVLAAGERRLKALKMIGVETTSCHVVGVGDSGVIDIEYAENEERKPFTPTEKYAIYDAMKSRLGIAKGGQVGKEPNNKKQKSPLEECSALSEYK